LIIFDTTLRDGEQSPGASMTKEEKLRIARQLERMRVDVIEAGFPAASNGDFDAVRAVAEAIKDSTVAGLCRAFDKDIRAEPGCRQAGQSPVVSIPSSPPARSIWKRSCAWRPTTLLSRRPRRCASPATGSTTSSSPAKTPDAPTSTFLCRIIEAVIKEGATTINIPDTVGYNVPEQYAKEFTSCANDSEFRQGGLVGALPQRPRPRRGQQPRCSDGGARQVECTINGLGERAGNAALEEIVMAVHTRRMCFPATRIDTTQIVAASKMVSGITGFPVQPNKAIVGANAFAHESGIHQDGVLKHRETYEIMRAEDVGWNTNKLVLGKHSGRTAFKARLKELGIEVDSEQVLNSLSRDFKELADKKHEIFDEDLHALMSDEVVTPMTSITSSCHRCSTRKPASHRRRG
jgi:2-isopropylmalate synthase